MVVKKALALRIGGFCCIQLGSTKRKKKTNHLKVSLKRIIKIDQKFGAFQVVKSTVSTPKKQGKKNDQNHFK